MNFRIVGLAFCLSGVCCSLIYYCWRLILKRISASECIREVYAGLRSTILILAFLPVFIGFFIAYRGNQGGIDNVYGIHTWHTNRVLAAIAIIWLIGVFCQIIRYTKGFLLQKRVSAVLLEEELYTRRIRDDLAGKLGIRRKIPVKEGYGVLSPEIYSVCLPQIRLPADSYTEEQLKGILLHELFHYKNHDLWIQYLLVFLSCVFWFVPTMKYWRNEMERWSERHCDLCVCESGMITPNSYACVLNEMADKVKDRCEAMNNLSDNRMKLCDAKEKDELMNRISLIRQCKVPAKRKWGLLALMLAFVLSAGGMTSYAAGAAIDGLNYLDNYYLAEGVKETLVAGEELVEYEASAAEYPLEINQADAGIMAEPNGTFFVTLKNNLYTTGYFKASVGQGITVTATGTPNTVTFTIGIIEPDGTRRFVLMTGSGVHTFKVNHTGQYHVFVQNTSSTSVQIGGSYATNAME